MSGYQLVAAPNPSLELAFDDIKRRSPLPLSVLEALEGRHQIAQRDRVIGIYREALTSQVKAEYYQLALGLHAKVEAQAESIRTHARVREAIGNRLCGDVAHYARGAEGVQAWARYVTMGQKLWDARQCEAWGVDPLEVFLGEDVENIEPMRRAFNRAGLVKLCPSDARREGARLSAGYRERLRALDQLGYLLRFAVVTLPNFPEWHLGSGLHEIRRRLNARWFRAKRDAGQARNWREPGRTFPDLVGALCTVEAPLSGRYDDPSNAWNVHANVILVFRPSSREFGLPDYGELRAAWGAHVHFETLPQGDPDALDAALKELLKYPVQAISEKSAEKRKPKRDHEGNLLPPAPPMVEWSAERIFEWIESHRSYRRTWSWGQLNGKKVEALDGFAIEIPKPAARDTDRGEWLGLIWTSPALVTVQRPMKDTRELDAAQRRRKFEHHARLSTDPEYATQIRERTLQASERAALRKRRRAAQDALLTFIQGNKFARNATVRNNGALPRAGPPSSGRSEISDSAVIE
jgi:hypothetical protein